MTKNALWLSLVVMATSCGFEGSGNPCTKNAECAEREVCVSGACLRSGGRSYVWRITSATVPMVDATGLEWDPVFPAPDVYAVLRIDLMEVGRTAIAQDSYTPSWTDSITAGVEQGSSMDVVLYDSDTQVDDQIERFSVNDVGAIVHAGGYSGAIGDGGTTLDFSVELAP